MGWALDLDGVVWLAGEPIVGAAEAVGRLQQAGFSVAFLTNNSGPTVADLVASLARVGIEARPEQVCSSAQAAATLLAPGERAFVLGGAGIDEALGGRGVEVRTSGPVDVVVVGLDRALDYERLTTACRLVAQGARLVGTNDDATYPTADGPLPGGGAVLAAVAYATGAVPVVAGKPYEAMVHLVAERIGTVEVMVGDRPSTDGRFALASGAEFALVLSGVTRADDLPVTPAPGQVAADLAALVQSRLA